MKAKAAQPRYQFNDILKVEQDILDEMAEAEAAGNLRFRREKEGALSYLRTHYADELKAAKRGIYEPRSDYRAP